MDKAVKILEVRWKVDTAQELKGANARVWPISTIEPLPRFVAVAETQFLARYLCRLHNFGVT